MRYFILLCISIESPRDKNKNWTVTDSIRHDQISQRDFFFVGIWSFIIYKLAMDASSTFSKLQSGTNQKRVIMISCKSY